MEKTSNSTEEETLTRKLLQEFLDEFDREETGKFCFQEEKVNEMVQELYKEITFSISYEVSNSPIFIHDAKNGSCEALVSASKSSTMPGTKVAKNRAAVVAVEKEDSTKTLFKFREEKNERRKNLFNDEQHLDCEWVGRILQNWWF